MRRQRASKRIEEGCTGTNNDIGRGEDLENKQDQQGRLRDEVSTHKRRVLPRKRYIYIQITTMRILERVCPTDPTVGR